MNLKYPDRSAFVWEGDDLRPVRWTDERQRVLAPMPPLELPKKRTPRERRRLARENSGRRRMHAKRVGVWPDLPMLSPKPDTIAYERHAFGLNDLVFYVYVEAHHAVPREAVETLECLVLGRRTPKERRREELAKRIAERHAVSWHVPLYGLEKGLNEEQVETALRHTALMFAPPFEYMDVLAELARDDRT